MASTGGAMYAISHTIYGRDEEQPLSPYGAFQGELYLNYYHEIFQMPFIVLRYSNVYGPRQNAHGESE